MINLFIIFFIIMESGSFAEAILREIVGGDGSLAAHLPHCSYIDTTTKNQTPRPACNCLHPVWEPLAGRERRPTTIEIGGSPFTSIINLVMHYYFVWLESTDLTYFQCLSILFEGTPINQIDRLHLYNRMRKFAMKSLGTGRLPEITDDDVQTLTDYFRAGLRMHQ
jgi:hypothetical protein